MAEAAELPRVSHCLMPRARAAAPHEMMVPARSAPPRVETPAPAPPRGQEEEEGEVVVRLSDFHKIGDLGEGCCGVVTKVVLRGTSAAFALKTAYYPDANAEEEVRVLRRAAGSPHLVRCHAVFRGAGGEPAVLLELMDAGSLGRVLSRWGADRGLPEPALAEVVARCLAGLADLHARGVAHLDVKPDNLLANARGDVKLADFSVSRIFIGDAGERLRVPVAVGSTEYMSPERFAPNAHAGPRGACAADIWGLGITVLELFLGRRPILPDEERPCWGKLMEAICYGQAPAVPASTAATAKLRGFVAACLQKDPRRRATVSQLQSHPLVARRDVEASRRALRNIIVETM